MKLSRTDSKNADFKALVVALNAELAVRDGDDHGFYMQFNGIDDLNHTIVIYVDNTPAACGAMKDFNDSAMEIKRMFTAPLFRHQGLAGKVLVALEYWAEELGFRYCVLETGKRQYEAVSLYKKWGYDIIPNYGPYEGVQNSLCFQKELNKTTIKNES
ncbi:MAG: GNAT family N-acetyltransferase [Flavobacteriaceae bacterium]|nr:GNAT family N-acetyltransferase [Flavobacteriaceae bacterium]